MRTSLNEIKLIDGYIFKNGLAEDTLLFDAMLILNPALSNQIHWQRKTHTVIQKYSRKILKAEMESVHRQLFNNPMHQSFKNKILSLFYKR
jgi:hypothetical protein